MLGLTSESPVPYMTISERVPPCELPVALAGDKGSIISSESHAPEEEYGTNKKEITTRSRPHAVLLPYPLQGHISPMVQFGKTLAIQEGFRVTFVNSRHNHESISRNNSSDTTGADSKSLIEFVWIDNGLPEDFDYSDIVPRFMEFHQGTLNMRQPFKDLLLRMHEGGDDGTRVSCVVFGSFCPWAHEVAREVGVPSVFFWTQSASVLDIYYHTHLLERNGFFPYRKPDSTNPDNEYGRLIDYLPGIPPLRPSDIPSLLHVESIDDPVYRNTKQQMDMLTGCKCAVINSFYELEVDACEALKAANGGSLSIHMVGPLLPTAFLHKATSDTVVDNDTRVGASLLEEKTDCIKWLDHQKEASVLYISFGSVFTPSTEEWRTIAAGVQASGQRFLWVIRPRSSLQSLSDILPEGFLEETKERGMIVPWAPQLQVLSHEAVGAFLSHCGWNSTLESISLGVPILPFPMLSDQPTDCRYIVDVWKIGLEFSRSPLDSHEVSRVVTMALQGDEGHCLRRKARNLREAARKATSPQGSSTLDLQRLTRIIVNSSNSTLLQPV